jgi:hypothetical protein
MPRRAFWALSAALLLYGAAPNGYAAYQPATVDAPIQHPAEKPCAVTLLDDRAFATFSPRVFQYAPPQRCNGPWSKVVLQLDTRVRGVQFDRIGELYLGRDELLRFSTAEPTPHGIRYRVEKDVTEYSPLLRKPQYVLVCLDNVVNKQYTGIFFLTARLLFYPAGPSVKAPPLPNLILPLDNEAQERPADTSGKLVLTYSKLPQNIVRARLDLYATNHGCDEFWYANQPDAYANAHKADQLCGGGAYRELDVTIDGRIAGIVYPFPYIWTGGFNPLLWRPLSAIHTLNVPAYRVDLDPWAGVLSDGKPHTFAVTVSNDRGTWPLDGNLLLWTDPRAAHTSGRILHAPVATAAPVWEQMRTTPRGDAFRFGATRTWRVAGYVDTSSGRVYHAVEDRMTFANAQVLDDRTGVQSASQLTSFVTTTTMRDAGGTRVQTVRTAYPLSTIVHIPPDNVIKPYVLWIEAHVRQALHRESVTSACDESVEADGVLKRLPHRVDDASHGTATERNRCRGSRSYDIHKSAVNGVLH